MSTYLSHLFSAGLVGIEAYRIDVELHIGLGLPTWNTVGLPESAVRESKDRVISAVQNCGYEFPYRKITINLAPADIRKEGTAFDLPIAVGLLSAAGLIPPEKTKEYLIVGELSLTGTVRKVRGALAITLLAKELGLKGIILPAENYAEAAVVQGIEVHAPHELKQVVEFLALNKEIPRPEVREEKEEASSSLDFSEIRGQPYAKRALEIAAAGFHNLLLVGPPGSGKTMLASRMSTILPAMSFEEAITTTKIYSLLGKIKKGESLLKQRPFRSPHHTISDAGLIGGGSHPKPGEVSLAHQGVLFLDELGEFERNVLDSLRQPIESGEVTISRAMHSITYPARFLLIAAMNPCPCGHRGNPKQACRCTPFQLERYRTKISGPLLDRIDLQIEVPAVPFTELIGHKTEESSEIIRKRVLEAQKRQETRLKPFGGRLNSQMGPTIIRETCQLEPAGEKVLEQATHRWQFSARTIHRILKVARTIADLKGEEKITIHSLTEAIQYRVGEQ